MKTAKKILSMILAFVMVLGLLPATAFASGAGTVYISVSYDGKYIDDCSGNAIAYEAFAESNRMDDGTIRENFNELYRLMNGMELREMDKIVYPVCTLCRDHQCSGFVEGIRIGLHLSLELME